MVIELKKEIDFAKIEKKWQKKWADEAAYEVEIDSKKKKFYVLEMFPYPSASGLHMGHALNYTIGDIFARFKKMQGFNVLHPMGFDSFGLPAENAAIKAKSHPKKFTEEAIKNYITEMKQLGLSYDWNRMVQTHKPDYYTWDQWIFLKMFEKGLAYKKKSPVNFCPKCNTVLANEQVSDGKCWRHEDTDVEIKHLEQWFFKTTAYADELYEGLNKLDDWPEIIKIMQRNWIGKSEGSEIDFIINGEKWPIFTTRADTLMGVTFVVISAQHPRLMEIVTKEKKKEVENFVKKLKSTKQEDMDMMDKEGVFTGAYAIHPITGEKVQVWAGNFVVADYGSGMVMAVPAHDKRDYDFAKKYNIPIKQVIAPKFITTSGQDAVRKDKPVVERDAIFAIVKHWKEDKYFCLNWKEFGWKSFVIGGIEKGEKPEDAARREVIEETGFSDIKSITSAGFDLYSQFFARHKDVNRSSKFRTFLVQLKSGKREETQEEHTKNHSGEWIDKGQVAKYLNLENNKYLWNNFVSGGSAFTDYGVLINSGPFDGLESDEAKVHVTKALEEKKLGRFVKNYRLRDWLISRQRFWGTPIPIVYCDKCGVVPVSEKDLPVKLPEDIKFNDVKNPLNDYKPFVETNCPKCKGKARRETDTMDTFVNSSWYNLRYVDPKNSIKIFDSEKAKYWAPIDLYIGGKEHACLHLIYIRFYTKFLRDLGLIKISEPALRLFNQGMLLGPDGEKMSKSKGNVVLPQTVSNRFGIDAARLFLVSIASPDKDINWSDQGAEGSSRFIKKMFEFVENVKIGKSSHRTESKINKAIKEISQEIEYLKYNFAVIKIRELFESLEEEISKKDLESVVKLIAPFCPHIAEELWEKIGGKGFVSLSMWPIADENKIDLKIEEREKAVEKAVGDILNVLKIVKEKQGKDGENVYLYVMPNELEAYQSDSFTKRIGVSVKVYAVNDKNKYDPEGKAGKAKPGKPGIFIE
jgi:leucyl-tRNA synthetase